MAFPCSSELEELDELDELLESEDSEELEDDEEEEDDELEVSFSGRARLFLSSGRLYP